MVSEAGARQAEHNGLRALANGDVLAPDEMAMKLSKDRVQHVKGAYLGGEHLAFKVPTGGFPDGANSGFTSVSNARTGAPAAI